MTINYAGIYELLLTRNQSRFVSDHAILFDVLPVECTPMQPRSPARTNESERETARSNAVLTESPASRLCSQVYERVRAEQPNALSKLRAVEGDVAKPGLGLRPEDEALLQERVAVVFHMAATVRFDEPFRKAVLENVRGTREVCELARGMARLQAFVHVSTAFCNSDKLENEERLYPPPGDWRTHIIAAETLDTYTVDVLTPKLLGASPNTYVFTKALAEQLINDYAKELPISIIRPSIVCNSIDEPFPGWTDNFNGPFGFIIGAITGILHVFYAARHFDVIPVDVTIKSTIALALKTSTKREMDEVPICNSSSHEIKLFDVDALVEQSVFYSMIEVNRLSSPLVYTVSNSSAFTFFFILLTLPLMFIADKLTGGKKRLMKMCRTIFVANQKTLFFQTNSFWLPNNRCMALNKEIHPDDERDLNASLGKLIKSKYYGVMFHHYETHFLNKDLKEKFPWQDFVLLIIHFIMYGLLLLFMWKFNLLLHTVRFMVGVVRMILAV